ncbi:unnamed protein product [Rotaria sp. Silwood2]|nr:unnamed protein product [Rotaria sp. Silwood2]CAF4611472.1 unnamed protein product [Rotaria sp. Silwood2]
MSGWHSVSPNHLQQQKQSQKSSTNNRGHQGHYVVHSSQRPHTTSDDDITEHEDFVNDASTKIVQRRCKRKQVQTHAHNYNTRQNAYRQSHSRTTAVQLDSTQLIQSSQSIQCMKSDQFNQQQATTMTASTLNNDQLTEEAEMFARTRYSFPPFIICFPSSNIKEQ